MSELKLLEIIRPIWINRAVQTLAKGVSTREDLLGQIENFYNLMFQAIETGDPSWLDSVLSGWASSLTQTDLESPSSILTQLVNEFFEVTLTVCQETLDEVQAMRLLRALLPCFSHAHEKAAQFEIQARVSYVSQQLNQAQQVAERLDRSKSDFIAIAAHELRTPLTLIEGYTSMLGENIRQEQNNSNVTILLEGIQNGVGRLQSIINDMIDVSMIDNNLLKLHYQPVWLNQLLTILISELESTLQERKLSLEIIAFPGYNEVIFVDPERIMQVFRNILSNAIKFTPDGGKIQINGRKLSGFIEVTVSDTGIGIDPEDQTLIFEKFGRVGNSALHSSGKTKFKGGGPGLGLHIAKGIIETHGGAIWVESPGYDEIRCPGSTFHILLPIQAETPDQKLARLYETLSKRQPAQ
ncbi:MAG: HAMP domain-containing sensor histidine kinase [Anaerolineales bacterium]